MQILLLVFFLFKDLETPCFHLVANEVISGNDFLCLLQNVTILFVLFYARTLNCLELYQNESCLNILELKR